MDLRVNQLLDQGVTPMINSGEDLKSFCKEVVESLRLNLDRKRMKNFVQYCSRVLERGNREYSNIIGEFFDSLADYSEIKQMGLTIDEWILLVRNISLLK